MTYIEPLRKLLDMILKLQQEDVFAQKLKSEIQLRRYININKKKE
jgi:hypothetical protein